MLVSTKGRYALRVMLELAQDDSAAYLPLPAIAERQGISEKYLESIISVLSKAGLVDGLRGKGGGYRLKKRQTIANQFLYTNRMIDRVELDNAFAELAASPRALWPPSPAWRATRTPAPAPVTAPRSPCGKSWTPSSTTIWTVSPWPIC